MVQIQQQEVQIKAAEQQRFEAAEDKLEFQRREYFGRI